MNCRACRLLGHKCSKHKHIRDNLEPNGLECVVCGKELTGSSKKYCSGSCSGKAYRNSFNDR